MDFFFRFRLSLFVLCIAVLVPVSVAAAATHTVSRGESLYQISSWYRTSLDSIKSANGLKSNTIYPGQKLYIPEKQNTNQKIHTVSRGESLYQISSWYRTSVDAIKSANGLKSNAIYPGQRLNIPVNTQNVRPQNSNSTVSRGIGNISRTDFDLLARIITAEADSESYTTKVAVGAVILNRVKSSVFPNTIPGVVYQVAYGRYQFEPVLNGWINRPASADSIRAAQDALSGWDPTNGALYFFESWVPNQYLQSKKVSTVLDSFIFSY